MVAMEDRYRLPGPRKREVLAEEMGKYSLLYALSEHGTAYGVQGTGRTLSGMDVTGIKEGIFRGAVKEGDEVEGEGMLSDYAAVYQPRAFYPPYVMGEIRAAIRRGQRPPSASPHYLPVSRVPPLPDGCGISFLYAREKTAFDRPDLPAHVRDVLTRDYPCLPVLFPPDMKARRGVVRFRARLLRLQRDTVRRLCGMGDEAYDIYAARGLVHFLEPQALEAVHPEVAPRGSLFVEMTLEGIKWWERACEVLERCIQEAVEATFPPCERGRREEAGCYLPQSGHHVCRFRSRLFAVVYDPVIAVMRAPGLLGVFIPADLSSADDGIQSSFGELVGKLASALEEELELLYPARVEVAYDNRLPWARRMEAMTGPSFHKLENEHPFLSPTLSWLRGW